MKMTIQQFPFFPLPGIFTFATLSLITKEYRTLSQIKGPLVFLERVVDIAYDGVLEISIPTAICALGRC